MSREAPGAFITGGAGAIGQGIARACLDNGWRVMLADIDPKALEAAADGLAIGGAVRPDIVVLDVRDPDAWESAAQTAEARIGPVTHLFNNAGVTSGRAVAAGGGIEALSVEEWRWTNAVNLDGVFFGLKTFIPRFKASGRPCHIVNTASMAAIVPLRVAAAIPLSYAASKAGVAHMTAQLRTDFDLEGVRNIGLSVLYPGMVRSNIKHTSIALSPGTNDVPLDDDLEGVGIDPMTVGRHVLRAIARGDFHIMTHAEWSDNVRAYRTELDHSFIESADPAFVDPVADMIDLAHAQRETVDG